MTEFFLTVVNMSISASWLILAILLLRLLLKKAPKWMSVLLWGIVAVRLICPFTIESALSLIPSAETISPQVLVEEPEINTGISFINSTINPIIQESTVTFEPEKSVNTMKLVVQLSSVIWVVGVAGMLVYTAVSYWRVKRKIGTSVLLRDNIFQSENVVSPFVLGIFKPRIFLPFHLNTQDLSHVIAHEQAHIQRKDHWWKPFGFLLLSIHWFNPLMWLGYILLCRDIELACDEKVIKEMDTEQKADYSQALLTCSVNRRTIAACPLAFGEVSVKNRVKSVLNYKKPAFWIVTVAVAVSIAVAVCFLTNPKTEMNAEMSACMEGFILTHHRSLYKSGEFACADFQVLDAKKDGDCTTVYMWVLYQEYTDDNGQIEEVSGGHIPTVVTLRKFSDSYVLEEYWEPRDGSYYAKDIRDKFPWYLHGRAIDSQRYIKLQQKNCYKKATEYFASVSDIGGVDESENVEIYTDLETTFSYAGDTDNYSIHFNDRNLTYVSWSDIILPPIYRLDTTKDWTWFKQNIGIHYGIDQSYEEVLSFDTVTADYDKAFFDDNSLIVAYVASNNITQRYAVHSIECSESSFKINLKETTGSKNLESGMTGWFVTVAVPDEMVKNCTSFNVLCPSNDSDVVYYFPDENGAFTVRKHYAKTPTEKISELIEKEEFVYTHLHYLDTFDKKWICEGYEYTYRLEVTGRMNHAAKNTTYVILCNESITFDQAWKASGFSSNSEDYFDPADALIVGYRSFSGQIEEPAESNPPATTPDNDQNSNYKLIVAGKDITKGNYLTVDNITDNSCDIHLPFTAIAQCYGVTVNRKSDTVTELTYQGTKYILNLSDVSLVKEGDSINYIIPAPGSNVQAQVMGEELVLDDVTLRTTFSFMGIQVQIRISHQDKTVTIQRI